MAATELSVGRYTLILVVLIVLTAATVGVSFAPLESRWHVAAGLVFGILKGTLVLLYFMHAIFSPKTTWSVIVVAVGFIFILFSLTWSDYLTRELVPYSPGH